MALSGPGAALASDASGGSQWPSLEALMRSYVQQGKVANMVAALGWNGHDPDFIAMGDTSFTSGASAGPDTLYRIYSMTKPVTGMAVMMCIADGLLELDQPIADLIPGFATMQVQKTYDGAITSDNLEPANSPITVKQCLTHTAGLGYPIVQAGPIAKLMSERGLMAGQATRLPVPGIFRTAPAPSLEIFAERLAEVPLVRQPGTRWVYSLGLDLLGRVIELVSGKAFDAFLQDRIFDPCDMSSTWFRVPENEVSRFTANYYVHEGTLLPIDLPENSIYLDEPAFPFGGGGLVSTARDYDRFLQMLAGRGTIDGTQVMDAASVRLATSDLLPATLEPRYRPELGGRQFGFGAGGLVGQGDADGLFGWFGAAGTGGLVNLKLGLRETLMTQYMPAEAYALMEQFPVAVMQDVAARRQRGE